MAHLGFQHLQLDLGPGVELEDGGGDVLDVAELHADDGVPGRVLWQRYLQHPRCQPDAGRGHRLGTVAHEHVRAQGIVHVVPEEQRNEQLEPLL